MRHLRYLAVLLICISMCCACSGASPDQNRGTVAESGAEPEGTVSMQEETAQETEETVPAADTSAAAETAGSVQTETDSVTMTEKATDQEASHEQEAAAESTEQPTESSIRDTRMAVETETGTVWAGVEDGELTFVDAHDNIYKTEVHEDWPLSDLDPLAFHMRDYSLDHDYWETEDMRMVYDSDEYDYRLGIDVFGEHGGIDWWAVEFAGYDFAIMRAGYRGYKYPGLVEDERVIENVKGALKYGLDVGVYFFSQAINEEEAEEEAEFVMEMLEESGLGPEDLAMGIIYDPESILFDDSRTDDVTGEQFTANTIAFCERAREEGYNVMVYSNMIWEAEKLDLGVLRDYPVWYADYTDHPQTPYAFDIWQYGHGIVPGVASQVDVNIQLIRKQKNIMK